MDRFLIFCVEDLIQVFKYSDEGQLVYCPYRGNKCFTYSNNKEIWEVFWNYILDSYAVTGPFGVTCIYSDFDFQNAFKIVYPLRDEVLAFLQINSLESVLPELMVKKRLLVNNEKIHVKFGKKIWEVSSVSCLAMDSDCHLPCYVLHAEDVVSGYFSPLLIGKNEEILTIVQPDEKSGDLARYVNTSIIKNYK